MKRAVVWMVVVIVVPLIVLVASEQGMVPPPQRRTGSDVTAPLSGWNHTYSEGCDYEAALSLTATHDGGYAFAGIALSREPEGATIYVWLVKTDAAGVVEWSRTYEVAGHEGVASLVATVDGGYAIAGSTRVSRTEDEGDSDVWLLKTDAHGDLEWQRIYEMPKDNWAYALAATADGDYVVAGDTRRDVAYGSGEVDVLLMKIDAQGAVEWTHTYTGPSGDSASSVVVTRDGGYAIAGFTHYPSVWAWDLDFWLLKTDPRGAVEWNQTYGRLNWDLSAFEDRAESVVTTTDGGYAVVGISESVKQSDSVAWLVKTDAAGVVEWSRTVEENDVSRVACLIQTADNGYAVTGYTLSQTASDAMVWLVKTDAAGTVEWRQTFGGMGWDDVGSVVETGDGGYVLAGHTDFDGGDQSRAWLVKTYPPATVDAESVAPGQLLLGAALTVIGFVIIRGAFMALASRNVSRA